MPSRTRDRETRDALAVPAAAGLETAAEWNRLGVEWTRASADWADTWSGVSERR